MIEDELWIVLGIVVLIVVIVVIYLAIKNPEFWKIILEFISNLKGLGVLKWISQ